MRYYIVDISGRVVDYDVALFNAVYKSAKEDEKVELFIADAPKDTQHSNIKRLLSLIPSKLKTSESRIKRLLKALETIINYIYIYILISARKPEVVHFQWLPFLEVCSLEQYIVALFHFVSPRSKLVLTVHNVYPHGYSEIQKENYKKRFLKISCYFDLFIAHTHESKKEILEHFYIDGGRVAVVHHGVFEPELGGLERNEAHERLRLISYGNQDFYKGTDLILDAMTNLPQDLIEKVELSIIGRIHPEYLDLLKSKEKGLHVNWKPYFVDEKTLYQSIIDSDVILLPYRAITQSGVLLLALNFDRPVVCSDLPPFKETMNNYPKSLFFKAGDAKDLSVVIAKLLLKEADIDEAIRTIRHLRHEYSWDMAAKKTLEAYRIL